MTEDKRTIQEGITIKEKAYQPKHAAEACEPKSRTWTSFFWCILIAFTTAMVFNAVLGIAVVSGTSMEPALLEGDVLLFWKLSNSYRRGDVVLIKKSGSTDYVKRICAVSGDRVEYEGNPEMFLINGEVLKEPYICERTYGKAEVSYPITLGKDEYFVMGDHRSNSYDSRNYGAVNVKQIDGRVLFIFRSGL